MTYYITSPYANRARRMIQRMMEPDWLQEEQSVAFPLDVKAEDEAYLVTALVPGIKADDLNIQIVNETLSIQGEMLQ